MADDSSNSSTKRKQPGNTKQVAPAKKWCFTYNNYSVEDYSKIIEILSSNSSIKYIIGEEIGASETPHLQGYINSEKKIRPFTLFPNMTKIHWEKCKGSEEQNIKYCSKDGKFKTNIKIKKPIKTLSESQLRIWQKEIIDIITNEPDDRKIYWYWEPEGNMGKTTFGKYLSIKHGAIPIEGKKNDILYCAAEHESEIYIFDFERSMEEYISYAAMEKIKNGYYMCSKYESKPIIRNPPHIVCFANFEPDLLMLSQDRWIIKLIKQDGSAI